MCHTLDPVYSSCLSAYYWQGLWWKEIGAIGSRGHLKFSDVLNADIRILDDIDSYYTDPYCNITPIQTKFPLQKLIIF